MWGPAMSQVQPEQPWTWRGNKIERRRTSNSVEKRSLCAVPTQGDLTRFLIINENQL